MLVYLAAGTGVAGFIAAIVSLVKLWRDTGDRADARRRRQDDAGREATRTAFDMQLELNQGLRVEISRLNRQVAELERDVAAAKERYTRELADLARRHAEEVGALRSELQELRRRREA